MGISPIEYRPWKGQRTAQKLRLYVIARSVWAHKLKSTGVLILLILGFLFVHTLYLVLVILAPHERVEASDMDAYLGSGMFATFAMLLAAVVASDLISEDLANNSFVLYFSRALKVRDYLIGKAAGALLVMSLLCFIPPILVAFVALVTQSGDDYLHSLGILGRTALVGLIVTVFFVPFAMMISSFTKRKSYAAVGTFMSFFVLAIVSGIFYEFDRAWRIISPIDAVSLLSGWILKGYVPGYIDEVFLVSFVASLIVVPIFVVYYRVTMEVVGK